jgi:hypothetical protein
LVLVPAATLLLALLTWVSILAVTWPTYYGINHTGGTVAALADAALRGQAPGREDGTTFLATVYFPPVPLAVAAAHRMGLGWRDALRALSALSAAALLLAAGWAVRALGGGAAAVAVTAALMLVAAPFKAASLAGRADLLAAALGTAAFAAWLRDRELRGWAPPLLAAAAALTKATALAVPLAAAWWVWRRGLGASARRFALRFALGLGVGALLTGPWLGLPWYADALRTLLIAPPNSWNVLRGPAEMLRYLGVYSELAALAALGMAMLRSDEWRGTPAAPVALASLVLALAVLANRGSDHNHLVEPCTVLAVCAGVWAEQRLARGALLVSVLLAVAVASSSWRDMQQAARQAGRRDERRVEAVESVRAQRGAVLTEDPLLALAAGKRPSLSDPAVLRSLERRGDPRARRLLGRVADGAFDVVVLNEDLASQPAWYRDFHLGAPVAAAIQQRYRPVLTADGFHFYGKSPWWRSGR